MFHSDVTVLKSDINSDFWFGFGRGLGNQIFFPIKKTWCYESYLRASPLKDCVGRFTRFPKKKICIC